MMSRPTGKRDEAQIRKAIQSFMDGEKTEDIAAANSVTQPTISYWLKRHGKRLFGDKFKLRNPGRPQLSEPTSRDMQILQLRRDGKSMAEIANHFDPPITRSRVSKIIAVWTERGWA